MADPEGLRGLPAERRGRRRHRPGPLRRPPRRRRSPRSADAPRAAWHRHGTPTAASTHERGEDDGDAGAAAGGDARRARSSRSRTRTAAAWSLRGPLCEGWPVHDLSVDPADRRDLRRRRQPLVRPGRSGAPTTWAQTWTHSSAGLTYGDDGPAIPTVWNVTAAHGAVYAGVEPAGLFRSDDGGATWAHVAGLTEHPSRPEWQPGNGGLILHTIVPHATDPRRMWVGISSVGTFETRDGGADLGDAQPRRPGGLRARTRTPSSASASTSSSRRPASPRRSTSRTTAASTAPTTAARTWTEITAGLPSEFGFPMVAHPRDPATAWVIPLNGADRGRYMPDAAAAVWRTRDRGATLGAPRRRAAPGARVPRRPARGDGGRPPRPGRASTSGPAAASSGPAPTRAPVWQPGRGPPAGRSGRSRPSSSTADAPWPPSSCPRSLVALFPGARAPRRGRRRDRRAR